MRVGDALANLQVPLPYRNLLRFLRSLEYPRSLLKRHLCVQQQSFPMLDLLKENIRAKREAPHHYQTPALLSIRSRCMKMGSHTYWYTTPGYRFGGLRAGPKRGGLNVPVRAFKEIDKTCAKVLNMP